MGLGSGCPRTFCKKCEEEMIHRDHRGPKESASALGQIVGREGPVNLSVTDGDLITRKGLRSGLQLLRFNEQKQPGHRFEGTPQERTLRLVGQCIDHCVTCPAAAGLHLDPRSGLYVVRGLIAAEKEGHRVTRFDGPQQIIRWRDRESRPILCHEDLFRLLDPEDPSRRRGMGWKGVA